jgi:hypothetical protein
MRLNVFVEESAYALDVPDSILTEGTEFFEKMDRDMDGGWQISREYVEHPDAVQRCQIVADKLLTSMMNGNKTTAMLMAGYILRRLPGVTGVDVDTNGEMQNTEMIFDKRS